MPLPRIEIPSKVVKRGNSLYLLLPPPVKHNCDIKPGRECTIELGKQNRIQIAF